MDADDLCPMTLPGYNADMNGCDSTQKDGDGDGVNDAMDTNCPNSPEGESVNSFGCAPAELDDDNDGVANNLDQCANTLTTWIAGADGCSPQQVDSDGDMVMDATDACPDTHPSESVDSVGCSLTQIDSDGDGVNDAQDAFPDDPNEVADSDGDGVGDVADYYPRDAARSVEEGSFMPFWIALVIVVFIGIAGVAVFIVRRSRGEEDEYAGAFSMDPQPSEDIYAMAGVDESTFAETPQEVLVMAPAHATMNEHGQKTWADEAGVSLCQDPDGSLRRYDAESGAWVPHQ